VIIIQGINDKQARTFIALSRKVKATGDRYPDVTGWDNRTLGALERRRLVHVFGDNTASITRRGEAMLEIVRCALDEARPTHSDTTRRVHEWVT